MARDFSREEIRGWERDNEVTIEFMDRVKYQIEKFDVSIHALLYDGKAEKALAINARMQQLKEVLLIPGGMIKGDADKTD